MSKTTDMWRSQWIKEVLKKGEKQIKKELYDYWSLMNVHSKVLDMISNGKMSKTNYTFEAIKEVYEEEKDGRQMLKGVLVNE